MRVNTYAPLLLFSAAMALSSCDSPVSCAPADVSRANANNGELNLARRISDSGADSGPLRAKNPQVRVYLDVSYSLRGFITGATCQDCASPRNATGNIVPVKNAKAEGKAAAPFSDPLFATLVTNLTNLPLRSLPGAPIQYYTFAEKLTPVEQEAYSRISRDPDCYNQNIEANRKTIQEGVYRPFQNKCFFDSEKAPEFARVGNRDKSPFQQTLQDIVQALEDPANPVDEGLFVIATDLFIAKNQDVIGPNAAVVAPLARLIGKGYQVRLFGFQLPFSGRIDDAPVSNFRVRGMMPFYYLAIGTPNAVNRFHRQVLAAGEQIQIPSSSGEQRIPLSSSDRFRAYAIGGSGIPSSPSLSIEYGLPPSAIPGPPVVISTDVDTEMEVKASDDHPVTVIWRRPASSKARMPIQPAAYRVDLLAWRWTRQAADGDACALSWELVPREVFNPTPLTTTDDPDVMTMELFRNAGAGVERDVPYILHLSLSPVGNQRDFGWIDAWSSDVSTMGEDLEAARSSGAFIRTYNLSTLLRSLTQAAPITAQAPTPPLASSVLAVRFK